MLYNDLLRGSPTHNWLGSSMTIINQDDAPQACPTGKHFLISYDSSLCEAHVKTTQNN